MSNKPASQKTSYDVRRKWDKEHHKIYAARLRIKEDAEIIEYLEANKGSVGTSQIIRNALQLLMEKEG